MNMSSGSSTTTSDSAGGAVDGEAGESGNSRNQSSSSQSINNDSRLAVQTILSLWERVVLEPLEYPHHQSLVAPLARLLGLLATAGLTPRILRRMLSLAQSAQVPPLARLSMVRALKTAAAGAARSSLLPKMAPRQFFCFGGGAATTALQRTISGLAAWPFRNDFGMAVWFRAERFDTSSSDPILLSARSEDGGGVEISIVPIEQSSNGPESGTTADACTIAISIFDSGDSKEREEPSHYLIVRGGCVLLPRVWYHLAVRHTRSRLKGVFSLSTRQQVSVMLDGKIMITESLQFPKMSDSDFAEESSLMSTLRRSAGHSSLNMTLKFGDNFEGQTGAIHVFNDNVSDASFRALYEATGGSSRMLRRSHSLNDSWDARRSDIVRRSRVLDANHTNDDSDDIILSQRRHSGKKKHIGKTASVIDLLEGEEQEDSDLPVDLQKAAFGSKMFISWDPRRTSGSLALELHIGAHVNLDGVYSWGICGAQDVISSTGGVQSLVPLFRSFLNGEIERGWAAGTSSNENRREVVFTSVPDLFKVLRAFIQDHNDNIRELLRCGGIDVIEQLLHNSKKVAAGRGATESTFGALSSNPGLALMLVNSLLELRQACSHNVGLETKIYSRILYNVPLWVGGFNQIPGVSLHAVFLPVLSHLTKINPEKARDCVGVRDLVNTLKEYALLKSTDGENDVDRFSSEETSASCADCSLTMMERRHVTNVILGMIFNIIGSGTSPHDLAPFIHFLSINLEDDQERPEIGEENRLSDVINDKRRITVSCCTLFLFLLQVRPVIPGLFESFAHTCGGVQGAVSWILSAMVNSLDDTIRSLGIRCVAAYLDVTSRGADAPLSLGSLVQPAGSDHGTVRADMSSTVRRASHRFTRIAQGLASMGPRAIVLAPSKLTARVVFKVSRVPPSVPNFDHSLPCLSKWFLCYCTSSYGTF